MARYDPFEEMDRMFEQLRTRTWTPDALGRTDFGMPTLVGGTNMDLKKHGGVFGSQATEGSSLRRSDGEYVFVADLPGFETEDIDLTFEDGALVLAAESNLREETTDDEMSGDEMADAGMEKTGRDETAGTDRMTVRREFTRSRRVAERVTVPEEVVEDDISATYRNGVLEVHLPLVEAAEADEDAGKKIDIAD